ncbi:MAG: CDP-alcohol phosphatidyltransferase family protein [Deltaproteobacteria bacterium]
MSINQDSHHSVCAPPQRQRRGSSTLNRFGEFPNQITSARLLLVPALWVLAVFDMPRYIGFGLIIAALTDLLDGYFARRLDKVSGFGRMLDSLADNILLASVVAWVVMLEPEVYGNHPVLVWIWASVNVLSLVFGWLRFGRFGNRPFYSVKLATVLGYIFVFWTFAVGYSEGLFYLAMGCLIFASAEALALQLVAPAGSSGAEKSIICGSARRQVIGRKSRV